MSIGESPRSCRWARTPSVAPKNNDLQDSLSWRVAPVKKRDVWSGDPDFAFTDMACQAVLHIDDISLVLERRFPGHDVLKSFRENALGKGNLWKTGF